MDFERTFWDEQTPITPQELNRIESGIKSLYEMYDRLNNKIRIYTGSLTINPPFIMDPKEVQTYKVSCPGSDPNYYALVNIPGFALSTLSIRARALFDEVEVQIENLTDYVIDIPTAVRIYVATLAFLDYDIIS